MPVEFKPPKSLTEAFQTARQLRTRPEKGGMPAVQRYLKQVRKYKSSLFERAFAESPHPAVLVDDVGTIIHVSKEAEVFFEKPASEIVGKSIHTFVWPLKTKGASVTETAFNVAQTAPAEGNLEMAPIVYPINGLKLENLALWRFSRHPSGFYTVTFQRIKTALTNPIVKKILSFEKRINDTDNPEEIRHKLLESLREISGADAAAWFENTGRKEGHLETLDVSVDGEQPSLAGLKEHWLKHLPFSPIDGSINGRVAQTESPERVLDIQRDSRSFLGTTQAEKAESPEGKFDLRDAYVIPVFGRKFGKVNLQATITLYMHGKSRFYEPLLEILPHLANTGALKIAAAKYQLHQDKQLEIARKEAATDPITGLQRRTPFKIAVEEALERLRNGGRPFAIVACDSRNLGVLNEAYGHKNGGDLGLKSAGEILSKIGESEGIQTYRAGDTSDEFFSIVIDPEKAEQIARRMREESERKLTENPDSIMALTGFSLDAAVHHVKADPGGFSSLMDELDRTLKDSKYEGRREWPKYMIRKHLELEAGLPSKVVSAIRGKLARDKFDNLRSELRRELRKAQGENKAKLESLQRELEKRRKAKRE